MCLCHYMCLACSVQPAHTHVHQRRTALQLPPPKLNTTAAQVLGPEHPDLRLVIAAAGRIAGWKGNVHKQRPKPAEPQGGLPPMMQKQRQPGEGGTTLADFPFGRSRVFSHVPPTISEGGSSFFVRNQGRGGAHSHFHHF